MIKLSKLPKPNHLAQNEAEWTASYIKSLEDGNNPSEAIRYRYRHPSIKSVLRQEAHDKCAYCESKISHVFPGETDHIYPVSKRPDLIVDWQNLTYVCTECNREKSDYYSDEEPLVNPYTDEPSEHLRFYGPMILNAPGDQKGYRTTRILRLSRSSLLERRKEKIERLQSLVDNWRTVEPGRTKNLIKQQILEEAATDREYSATSMEFLRQALDW